MDALHAHRRQAQAVDAHRMLSGNVSMPWAAHLDIPMEQVALVHVIDGERELWVFKNAHGSKGSGLRLARAADALRLAEQQAGTMRVVQRYVEQPLLLDGG